MVVMELDNNGLEVLSRSESLALLALTTVARVGVTVDALPVVLPVNFAFDGKQIVLRSAPGTKLSAALANAVIAFEADAVNPMDHSGWSVLIQGMSRVLTDPQEIEAAKRLPLRPGANEGADQFIVLEVNRVSGRRLNQWERATFLPHHTTSAPVP
jgi:nitroimidazol reductase NimA-like FMN-containing flavoprotein (pyridoxamine 5'-phosphate oxidase superfamily)